jgi:hypothetical protein
VLEVVDQAKRRADDAPPGLGDVESGQQPSALGTNRSVTGLVPLEAKLGVRTAADASRPGAPRERVETGHAGARVVTLRWGDQ